jgi:hypothetical protein
MYDVIVQGCAKCAKYCMIYRDVPDVQTNVVCFTKVCTMFRTVPYLQGCAERCILCTVF